MDERVVSGYLITRTLINPEATCALSPASARIRARVRANVRYLALRGLQETRRFLSRSRPPFFSS